MSRRMREGAAASNSASASSPEAAALQSRVGAADPSDPEAVKHVLSQLLKTREGQALARKIQEAMEHG